MPAERDLLQWTCRFVNDTKRDVLHTFSKHLFVRPISTPCMYAYVYLWVCIIYICISVLAVFHISCPPQSWM